MNMPTPSTAASRNGSSWATGRADRAPTPSWPAARAPSTETWLAKLTPNQHDREHEGGGMDRAPRVDRHHPRDGYANRLATSSAATTPVTVSTPAYVSSPRPLVPVPAPPT